MMKILIFFVRTNDFNLRKYKKKIFSQNKPIKRFKKISSNSFSCYLNNKKVEFSIVFEELEKYFLNEKIVNNTINMIVKLSFYLSRNIKPSEPIDIHNDSWKKLTNLILLKINNYFSYYINKNSDIFELVAFIEYSLLKNHILIDGNKRFAFSFLVVFLQLNGFDLKWDNLYHKDKSKKKYELMLIKWIKFMNKKKYSEQKIIMKMKKAISKHSIIKIN